MPHRYYRYYAPPGALGDEPTYRGELGPFCEKGGAGAMMWLPVMALGVAAAAGATMIVTGPAGAPLALGAGAGALLLLVGMSCGPWGDFRPSYCPKFGCQPYPTPTY